MHYFKFLPLLIFSFFMIAAKTEAHGLAVVHPIPSGEYLIEFEYEAPGQPAVDTAYPYAVYLLKQNSTEPIPFTSAQVKLSNQTSGTAWLATVSASRDLPGQAQFIASLPEAGAYTAEITIRDDTQIIASGQTSFTAADGLSAESGHPITGPRGWGIVVIALAIGLLIGLIIPRSKNKKN